MYTTLSCLHCVPNIHLLTCNIFHIHYIHTQNAAVFAPGPPSEIVVNGGKEPSLGHLRTALSSQLSAPSTLVIYKYKSSDCSWYVLYPGMTTMPTTTPHTTLTTTTTAITNTIPLPTITTSKPPNKKKADNILKPPFSFTDGDVICYTPVPTTLTPLLQQKYEVQVYIRRPEDIYDYNIKQIEIKNKRISDRRSTTGATTQSKRRKSINKNSGSGTGTGTGKKRTEVSLNLGGNLDFSDEEEDYEEGGEGEYIDDLDSVVVMNNSSGGKGRQSEPHLVLAAADRGDADMIIDDDNNNTDTNGSGQVGQNAIV